MKKECRAANHAMVTLAGGSGYYIDCDEHDVHDFYKLPAIDESCCKMIEKDTSYLNESHLLYLQ